MPPKRKPRGPVPVEAIKHRDKRVNIPTEELREFVRAEEKSPKSSSTRAIRLYSTVSRPFDPPQTGKIAVKVINHYGDEVLKVFEVAGAGTSAAAARTSA
jgi:hypothetical protein